MNNDDFLSQIDREGWDVPPILLFSDCVCESNTRSGSFKQVDKITIGNESFALVTPRKDKPDFQTLFDYEVTSTFIFTVSPNFSSNTFFFVVFLLTDFRPFATQSSKHHSPGSLGSGSLQQNPQYFISSCSFNQNVLSARR
jgi:hypothetical protein